MTKLNPSFSTKESKVKSFVSCSEWTIQRLFSPGTDFSNCLIGLSFAALCLPNSSTSQEMLLSE